MAAELPAAIQDHVAWLREHGEPVPADPPRSYRILEEVSVAGHFESGDDVGFYAPDAVPVSSEDGERYLRIASHAHDDLRTLVARCSDAQLDWVRDDRTRSIRQIIRHVVGAELGYMTRIIDDPEGRGGVPRIIADADDRIDATEDVHARLGIVWPAFQAWARSLSAERRGRITIPAWFTQQKAERWSARKMLRRCVEHCREHTCNIERILVAFQG